MVFHHSLNHIKKIIWLSLHPIQSQPGAFCRFRKWCKFKSTQFEHAKTPNSKFLIWSNLIRQIVSAGCTKIPENLEISSIRSPIMSVFDQAHHHTPARRPAAYCKKGCANTWHRRCHKGRHEISNLACEYNVKVLSNRHLITKYPQLVQLPAAWLCRSSKCKCRVGLASFQAQTEGHFMSVVSL